MAQVSLDDIRTDLLKTIRKDVSDPVLYELGSGITPHEEFVGLDFYATHERVKRMDLFSTPWDIPDESVDFYRSSHFLEHVPDWNAHFQQVYRTLKPGGYYEIIAPFYKSDRWWGDPDHKQPILYRRFAYLNQEWLTKVNIAHSPSNANVNFDIVAYFECLHDDYANAGLSDDALNWAKEHNWNCIDDLALVLKKIPMPEEGTAQETT
jgi:SAM-dependent methyltransferase